MTYTPPPFPVGLHPGGSKPSAKSLQAALKKTRYLSSLVVSTDKYGPLTQGGVKRFHAAHPAYGAANDGAIGPHGWAALFTQAYGGPAAPVEPSQDMHRVTYDGKTVNVRTRVLLMRAEAIFGARFYLVQGSYNVGVAASAGTHDGGGVVDVSVSGWSAARISSAVQALRRAGFAAWHRTPAQGFSHHIHACGIGDREMKSIAREQVQQYFNGLNGLAGHGPDTNPPRPYPAWAAKYNQ